MFESVLRGRPPTRRFKSSVFCGREELLWTFLTFKIIYIYKNIYKILEEMIKKIKHNRSPLKIHVYMCFMSVST